jgi:hypothetical protein
MSGSAPRDRGRLEVLDSQETEFCLDAIEIEMKFGRNPEIFHFTQRCQLMSSVLVAKLHAGEINTSRSWSGRKRCSANLLLKRL